MVNKRTFYAHLYKGRKHGRGYSFDGARQAEGKALCMDFWMRDRWPARVHDLRWLIERFWPVPTWPEDLDRAFRLPTSMNRYVRKAQQTALRARLAASVETLEVEFAWYGAGSPAGGSIGSPAGSPVGADVTAAVRTRVSPQEPSLVVENAVLGVDPLQGPAEAPDGPLSGQWGDTLTVSAYERDSLWLVPRRV